MISRLLNKPELLTADPYLNEYQPLLQQRKVLAKAMEKRLLSGHSSLADFAAGYEFSEFFHVEITLAARSPSDERLGAVAGTAEVRPDFFPEFHGFFGNDKFHTPGFIPIEYSFLCLALIRHITAGNVGIHLNVFRRLERIKQCTPRIDDILIIMLVLRL